MLSKIKTTNSFNFMNIGASLYSEKEGIGLFATSQQSETLEPLCLCPKLYKEGENLRTFPNPVTT